jgi:hypothetical protein
MWPADARAIFADQKQNALGTRLVAPNTNPNPNPNHNPKPNILNFLNFF